MYADTVFLGYPDSSITLSGREIRSRRRARSANTSEQSTSQQSAGPSASSGSSPLRRSPSSSGHQRPRFSRMFPFRSSKQKDIRSRGISLPIINEDHASTFDHLPSVPPTPPPKDSPPARGQRTRSDLPPPPRRPPPRPPRPSDAELAAVRDTRHYLPETMLPSQFNDRGVLSRRHEPQPPTREELERFHNHALERQMSHAHGQAQGTVRSQSTQTPPFPEPPHLRAAHASEIPILFPGFYAPGMDEGVPSAETARLAKAKASKRPSSKYANLGNYSDDDYSEDNLENDWEDDIQDDGGQGGDQSAGPSQNQKGKGRKHPPRSLPLQQLHSPTPHSTTSTNQPRELMNPMTNESFTGEEVLQRSPAVAPPIITTSQAAQSSSSVQSPPPRSSGTRPAMTPRGADTREDFSDLAEYLKGAKPSRQHREQQEKPPTFLENIKSLSKKASWSNLKISKAKKNILDDYNRPIHTVPRLTASGRLYNQIVARESPRESPASAGPSPAAPTTPAGPAANTTMGPAAVVGAPARSSQQETSSPAPPPLRVDPEVVGQARATEVANALGIVCLDDPGVHPALRATTPAAVAVAAATTTTPPPPPASPGEARAERVRNRKLRDLARRRKALAAHKRKSRAGGSPSGAGGEGEEGEDEDEEDEDEDEAMRPPPLFSPKGGSGGGSGSKQGGSVGAAPRRPSALVGTTSSSANIEADTRSRRLSRGVFRGSGVFSSSRRPASTRNSLGRLGYATRSQLESRVAFLEQENRSLLAALVAAMNAAGSTEGEHGGEE